MRFKIATIAALAAVAVAAPAQANEARAELRSGVFFGNDTEDALVGIAVGYDWSLSDTVFLGVEASADKVLDGFYDDVTMGVSARLGTNVGPARVYAVGGYQTEPCDLCDDAWSAGAGAQFGVSETVYLKAEYRHYFVDNGIPDSDAILVGVGIAMD